MPAGRKKNTRVTGRKINTRVTGRRQKDGGLQIFGKVAGSQNKEGKRHRYGKEVNGTQTMRGKKDAVFAA